MDSANFSAAPADAKPKTSGLAIVSLVTSLLCLGPVAVICGHIALSRIKRSAGSLRGTGLAIAALVIGYLSIVSYLTVVPVVFVGARAWAKGADRSTCIMNQRAVQMAVRNHAAINDLDPGAPMDVHQVAATLGIPLEKLQCPSGGTYDLSATIPATGDLAASCSNPEHAISDHTDW